MKSVSIKLALLAMLGASSCSPSIQFAPTNRPPRALSPRPPDTVEVFISKRPARAYTEVGLLHAEGSTFSNSRVELVHALRVRAAQLGCEALILTSSGQKVTGGVVHGSGNMATVSTTSVNETSAVCAVYGTVGE